MSTEQPSTTPTLTVMLYSDDRNTREQVRLALGKKVASDLPDLDIVETATGQACLNACQAGNIDLLIADAEAVPYGGMGVCRQLKDEMPVACPPVILLIARRDDAWMASWSRAEAVSSHPVDPVKLPETVATVIRQHLV